MRGYLLIIFIIILSSCKTTSNQIFNDQKKLIISLENQLRNTLPGEFAQKIMRPKYLTTKHKSYINSKIR